METPARLSPDPATPATPETPLTVETPAPAPAAVETPANGNGKPPAEAIAPADMVRPLSAEETRAAVDTPAPGAPAGSAPANPFAGVRDSLGREFNAATFRLKNGVPQVDSRGRFVPAGLGRRSGGVSTIGEPGAQPAAAASSSPGVPPPVAPMDEYHLAAQAAVRALYALGMLIGGDEWAPTDDEHANLVNATESYFRFKQVKDVPPGIALAIAVGGYVAPRLSKPKTLSRLARLKLWWASKRADRRAEAVADRAAGVAGSP